LVECIKELDEMLEEEDNSRVTLDEIWEEEDNSRV
jgi:hypothetical protein